MSLINKIKNEISGVGGGGGGNLFHIILNTKEKISDE